MFAPLEALATLAKGRRGRSGAAALPQVHRWREQLVRETDAQLKERADVLRKECQRRVSEAVALIAESVRRSHGITAYDVQLLAGLALAEGALVEMATGEGKTLAALLPAFVFALQGRGAHVATVNPYLAGRDAEFARPVFERLGLTVGLLRERDAPSAKAAAYACDVTYGVGAEFGFDYLRDQIAIRGAGRVEPEYHEIFLRRFPEQPVLAQRGHAFAIIDEADSVLLDEARSPLIIAMGGKTPNATPAVYRLAAEVARKLREGEHYVRESSHTRHTLTPEGDRVGWQMLTESAMGQLRRFWSQYLENALHALHGLRRDVHYIVADGKVMIVDEFTGRLCPDRSWRDGLHQSVEAHAGVVITEENNSEATISRPDYFQLYERVCGLSGTVAEASSELRANYRLPTVVVPLHRPCRRKVLPDRVFATRAQQHAAAARDIAQRHATGQPLLIGTRTVEHCEKLLKVLALLGLPIRVLSARQDAEEAAIIARAGEPGAITVATNLAGRGAHIPVPEESLRVGGLHVLGLERHESARIDRQLIGRGARQGQVGSAQFFLSLEDDLIRAHAPELAENLVGKFRDVADGELPGRYASHFLRMQRKVEAHDRATRRALIAHHLWLDEIKQAL